MSNKLLLAVIFVSLFIGVVCGIAVKSALTTKTVMVPGETKIETIIRKIPVKIITTKYIEKERIVTDSITLIPSFSLIDSVKGIKDSVEYEISHMIVNSGDSLKSGWNISVNSLFKDYIKEKLTVELKEVEVLKPFYADGWFWSTLIAVPLLLLAIVF